MTLRVNSDYFPKQNLLIFVMVTHWVFFESGEMNIYIPKCRQTPYFRRSKGNTDYGIDCYNVQ
jgi:hypothetical protein